MRLFALVMNLGPKTKQWNKKEAAAQLVRR